LRMHPQVGWRLLSRRHNANLYPVDVWALKGIVSWGVDSEELSGTIAQQWGRKPVQMYGSSEGGIMAMQDWRKGSMTLIPDACYYEFLPEASLHTNNPKTVLIDELKEGQSYELIISNFYGMPFARYRQGDLFRVERSEVPGGVPRFIFVGRADDSFDLFGIARVNTAIFSEALSNVGLSKDNWCIHKKYESNRVALDVFVETGDSIHLTGLDQTLNRAIKSIDRHWGEAVFTMAYNPIHVRLVPPGTFQKLGFHNNGSSPVKINPSEVIIKELISISEAER
jgi:phenylacetate-coenzyme A ligase PaaK-like adenylate-forming protein